MTRGQIEVLLDSPNETNYVVSAFADLRVKDGFRRFFEQDFRNQTRTAAATLSEAEARKALDENLESIRAAVREEVDPSARGVAVFASAARGLRHVVPLSFPVENHLVIDEEPFVLPLLERWHGEPSYLVAVVDANHAHIFEAQHGAIEEVREVDRTDVREDNERDKPRFSYKKRFAKAPNAHEHLQNLVDDKYFQDVAAELGKMWSASSFHGLILLGQPNALGAMRQLLPKELAAAVVDEATQGMTSRPEDVAADVARAVEKWHAGRDAQLIAELQQRWKEKHLVADGPTEVLDALQQGRAAQVIVGRGRDLPGARCRECGYRFGAPSETCVYCGGPCRTINAVQEILRMALRHRVAVHLFQRGPEPDPIAQGGGVTALLRAEANWAPDAETARATVGR